MRKIILIVFCTFGLSGLEGCGSLDQSHYYSVPTINKDLAKKSESQRDESLRAFIACLNTEAVKYAPEKSALPQDIASAGLLTCDDFAQKYKSAMWSYSAALRLGHPNEFMMADNMARDAYTKIQSTGRSFTIKRVLELRVHSKQGDRR